MNFGSNSFHPVSRASDDLTISLSGLDPELQTTLRGRYTPYVGSGEGRLAVQVGRDDTDYYIDPPEHGEFNQVRIACDGGRVRFLGYRAAGWFATERGNGQLLLARGEYEPADRAVENYVRAAVAWQAIERGGALVHGASAVLDGRGYLFFGPSGAGKSTLSECNRRARVVSDDLSLLLPGPAGLELVGSPFRGTYERGEPVVGRFPLAAGFRIVQAPEAEVRSVARVRTLAELVGNLPFVAEAFPERPDLFGKVERVFRDLPLAHLHFRKDESYWDAIARAGL